MAKNIEIRNSTAEFLIFMLKGEEDGIQVMYKNETIWATQKAISQLFDVGVPAISKHLKNIFESGELVENSVISKMETTASDGKNYNTTYYNLDAIISVGYRVNSVRATQFRQWCTFILRQFAIRGYVLDHKRMENGAFLGVDYFEHLLAEIREIRLSERRFYQKLTDIYATAIDYNKDAPTTRLFFKKVQNKIHYAVHGHTAAELIVERANADKEHMGLTTWENAPNGKIVKTDVSVAKNYLREKELEEMGRIVNASLIGRYNKYASDDKSLPQFRYSPEVSTTISYHIAKSGTDISFFYKYTGQRKEYYYHEYTTPDNKKESEIYLRGLPSYHYGDITVTQKLTSFLSLNVGVKNLFNLTDIRTIVESANDTPSVSYLGCGRSYFIGLNLMLNGKFKK